MSSPFDVFVYEGPDWQNKPADLYATPPTYALSTSNQTTHLQLTMEDSQMNVILPNSQPCMVCCTSKLSQYMASRQVQVWYGNHSGPYTLYVLVCEATVVLPLSECLAQCLHLAEHINTMKLIEQARTPALIHM